MISPLAAAALPTGSACNANGDCTSGYCRTDSISVPNKKYCTSFSGACTYQGKEYVYGTANAHPPICSGQASYYCSAGSWYVYGLSDPNGPHCGGYCLDGSWPNCKYSTNLYICQGGDMTTPACSGSLVCIVGNYPVACASKPVTLKDDGEPCNSDAICKSNICKNDADKGGLVCCPASKKSNGQSCSYGCQCSSGACAFDTISGSGGYCVPGQYYCSYKGTSYANNVAYYPPVCASPTSRYICVGSGTSGSSMSYWSTQACGAECKSGKCETPAQPPSLKANGASCTASSECQSSNCAKDTITNPSATSGICMAAGYCNYQSSGYAGGGKAPVCKSSNVAWECTSSGVPVWAASYCNSGQQCSGGTCYTPAPPQPTLKANGASCTASSECQSGNCPKDTITNPSATTGICAPSGYCNYLGVYSSYGSGSNAPVCYSASAPWLCGSGAWAASSCGSLQECSGGACSTVLKGTGEECTGDSECKSGYCRSDYKSTSRAGSKYCAATSTNCVHKLTGRSTLATMYNYRGSGPDCVSSTSYYQCTYNGAWATTSCQMGQQCSGGKCATPPLKGTGAACTDDSECNSAHCRSDYSGTGKYCSGGDTDCVHMITGSTTATTYANAGNAPDCAAAYSEWKCGSGVWKGSACSTGKQCKGGTCTAPAVPASSKAVDVMKPIGDLGKCAQNEVFETAKQAGIPIGALIGLAAVVIALLYMVGSVTANPNLIILAKDEMWHLLFSCLLLLMAGGILTFSCTFANTFGSYAYDTLGVSSKCYDGTTISAAKLGTCHYKRMESDLNAIIRFTTKSSIDYRMKANAMWGIMYPFVGGIYTGTDAWRKAFAGQFDLLTDVFAVPALVSVTMQRVFLEFIREYMVSIVLPFGIAFRFFPPLRDFGNLLIALGVGMFVVYPLLAAFNAMIYDAVFVKCNDYKDLITDFASGTCGQTANLWDIASVLPQAYFLPNLALALTITFISSIAKALKVIG